MASKTKELAIKTLSKMPRPIQTAVTLAWYLKKRGRAAPPKIFKYWLFGRFFENCDYIYESGTYLGESTAVLAHGGRRVDTVEPDPELHEAARRRFRETSYVQPILGSSEDVISQAIESARQEGLRSPGFWLDGHSSDDGIAANLGDAPVMQELAAIVAYRDAFEQMTVLIDDARYMAEIVDRDPSYPPLKEVIGYILQHDFAVYIEHNVIIARYSPARRQS